MKLPQSTLAALAMTVTSATIALGAAEKPNAPEPKLKAPEAPICKLPVCEVKVKAAMMTSAQIFKNADKDKDGKLSATEFEAAYKLIVLQEKIKAAESKPAKPVKPMPVAPPHPMGPGDGCPGCGLG